MMVKSLISLAELEPPSRYAASYALGLLDASALVEVVVSPDEGEDILLMVPAPAYLPPSVVGSREFQRGVTAGYEDGDDWGETPVSVVNWVMRSFTTSLRYGVPYEWVVGFLLGCLAVLAQEDQQLALVGMAHVCFLLVLVPIGAAQAFHEVCAFHDAAVNAYRAGVRALKERGVCISQAWRLALAGSNGKP